MITPFHSGPVSPTKHHITMTDGAVTADSGVSFHAYLDGGTADVPAHIVRVQLKRAEGGIVETWNAGALGALPQSAFANDYAYNKFAPGFESIVAPIGAEAAITLPPAIKAMHLTPGTYVIEATTIDAKSFSIRASMTEKSR